MEAAKLRTRGWPAPWQLASSRINTREYNFEALEEVLPTRNVLGKQEELTT